MGANVGISSNGSDERRSDDRVPGRRLLHPGPSRPDSLRQSIDPLTTADLTSTTWARIGVQEGGCMKRLLMVAASAILLVSAVSCRPRWRDQGAHPARRTAPTKRGADYANSACAASGLNDLDSSEGQNVSQVQTAADSWRYYGLPARRARKARTLQGGNRARQVARAGSPARGRPASRNRRGRACGPGFRLFLERMPPRLCTAPSASDRP